MKRDSGARTGSLTAFRRSAQSDLGAGGREFESPHPDHIYQAGASSRVIREFDAVEPLGSTRGYRLAARALWPRRATLGLVALVNDVTAIT